MVSQDRAKAMSTNALRLPTPKFPPPPTVFASTASSPLRCRPHGTFTTVLFRIIPKSCKFQL